MKAQPLVIDTSVALGWLMPRDGRQAEATALLDQHQAGSVTLHAPTHLLLEVMNALWAHRATAEQITRATGILRQLHIVFVEPDATLLTRAAAIAAEHRITVYDALFAALAEELACDLVTDDRRLASSGACKVRGLG